MVVNRLCRKSGVEGGLKNHKIHRERQYRVAVIQVIKHVQVVVKGRVEKRDSTQGGGLYLNLYQWMFY